MEINFSKLEEHISALKNEEQEKRISIRIAEAEYELLRNKRQDLEDILYYLKKDNGDLND